MEENTSTEQKETSQTGVLPTGETVDLKEFANTLLEKFNEGIKNAGVGMAEAKHGKLPVDLTEAEKKLPEADQNKIKVNKFFRAIYRKDLDYLTATKAINTEGTAANGGYLMSPEFSTEVWTRLEQYGVLDRYATKYNMTRQKLQIPVGNAKVTGAFANEGAARTESNPTFLQKELSRKEYAVLSVLSKQLLEDEQVNILPILADYVAEDFAYVRDYQGFLGSGSPITGICAGTTTTANIKRTGSSDFGASITGDLLIDVAHSLSPSRSTGAVFVTHRTALAQLRKLKDNDGNYIWQSLSDGSAGLICGYPVILSEAMTSYDATSPAADTPYLIFGNLKNCIIGNRHGIETAMTTDATIGSNNLFEKNLVGFRFEQSFDIIVPRTDDFIIVKSEA